MGISTSKAAHALGLLMLWAPVASAGLQTPSSVQLKVYEFWVSTSPLCTSPINIYKSATPAYTEMTTGPTLGSGSVAAGTYPCLIMVFSDQIKYTATATSGTCTAGTAYTKDICRDGDTGTNVDGTALNCATGVDDKITAYITTASNCTVTSCTGNSLVPPTASTNDPNGSALTSSLVVTASTASTFVFGVANGLDDTKASCSLENLSFSFR